LNEITRQGRWIKIINMDCVKRLLWEKGELNKAMNKVEKL